MARNPTGGIDVIMAGAKEVPTIIIIAVKRVAINNDKNASIVSNIIFTSYKC